MRVVLDTNILARAVTGPSGPASAVLRMIIAPHVLILSPFLLSELVRVLDYERLRRIHGLRSEGIVRFVAQLQAQSLLVQPRGDHVSLVVPHNPQDDPILATALAGGADVLCTRDRHFSHPDVLAFCARHSLRVCTDTELLASLRSAA